MEQYEGKPIFGKLALGRIFFYENSRAVVKREKTADAAAELARLAQAQEQAAGQLQALYEKACREVGEADAAIFEMHQMMLRDVDFDGSITSMIQQEGVNAEYAVAVTADNFVQMFTAMENDYMRARAADIRDISERLLRILSGVPSGGLQLTEPSILMAEDLAPSETVQLDKSLLLGFVTEHGSANSHTAILARTMNLPAVIGVPVRREWHGRMAIVDGFTGTVTIDPTEEQLARARGQIEQARHREALLKTLKGKETVTRGGRRVQLYANIGSVSDVAAALANDAEGIGLFRSEFLYLESDHFPTEEEQFQAYRVVAQNMAGKKVIIRTLDIGADKQADYLQLPPEENPALGCRAIRLCLTREDIFRTQLRAILRASAFGNLSVMFPMIISIEEIRRIKEILKEVKAELSEAGAAYREVETGIMIETPAAVWISEELAREVDFFSIGTNDLTQYTLAIDRQNPQLDAFFDAHHPAVLRAIRMTVENGHKGGAWVGICGELAADPALTETFVEMGVDELSVAPAFLLPLREKICAIE